MPKPDNDDILITIGELVNLRVNLASNHVTGDSTAAITKLDKHINDHIDKLNFNQETTS